MEVFISPLFLKGIPLGTEFQVGGVFAFNAEVFSFILISLVWVWDLGLGDCH